MSGRHPRKGEPGWTPRTGANARSGPSGHSGVKATKWKTAPFIGWDGEGVQVEGSQRYALLASSSGDRVWRDEGISTVLALTTLVDRAVADPGAIHVCFGASYDVNMMCRDLPALEVKRIWQGKRVSWDGFEIEYRARKSFTVRRWGTPAYVRGKDRHGKCWVPNFTGSLVLWDVLGFFQSTFVEAVRKYLGDEHPLLPIIVAGKARRSQFTPEERDKIEPYTAAELTALVELMERLRNNLVDAELPVQRWDGGGAIAASLLRRENVKEHIAPLPRAVEDAAQGAYAGGRMEVVRYGLHRGPVPHYDINSAYPYRATDLPSLDGGTWEHYGAEPVDPFAFGLVLVRWSLAMSSPGVPELYPFFYRDRNGSISFPSEGIGWHHVAELNVANEALASGVYRGSLQTVESWLYQPRLQTRPFAFLPELYAKRLAWKRAGAGAEKAAKIAINSTYGKLAQQTGYDAKKDRKPPFHSLVWAGYITAATRAELTRVALQNPRAVVMLATDGIYATEELDVPIGEQLGEWTAHTHHGILVAQSGVYYVMDAPHHRVARHRPGCTEESCETEFRRGFDDGSLSSGAIVDAWARGRSTCASKEHRDLGLHLHAASTRFVGMGSAIAGGDQWAMWRSWRTIDRALALTPRGTKRELIPGVPSTPHLGLVPTRAKTNYAPEMPSHPYPLVWRGEEYDTGSIDGVDARVYAAETLDAAV